jgi:Uma2 family endonuclease
MSTTTRLTFDEFQKLPDEDGTRYELDEGELLMEPSPTFLHNRIRDRIARRLYEFVEAHNLGEIIVEMDFRLAPDTVRSPDVAFVTPDHLRMIDINRSPVEGAPALAVEVISPSNLAQDTAKKVGQYLSAGSSAVWVVYPALSMVEVHRPTGTRQVKAPDALTEEKVFAGRKFTLSLTALFEPPAKLP